MPQTHANLNHSRSLLAQSMRACRRGFTLVEILVVIAVMAVVTVIALPALNGVLEVQQSAASRELGQTYTWLMDEATLRNVSFRIAYNLDRNTWKVEVGDPDTMVFSSPEEREEHEEKLADESSSLTEREKEELQIYTDATQSGEDDMLSGFEGLDDDVFKTEQALPEGTRFDYVYTPQYGPEGLFPHDVIPDDPEEETIAYSYIFSNGMVEHTIVRIVDLDGEDGQTLEVSPLDGSIRLTSEVIDPEAHGAWLPEEAPQIQ